jgi:hypothetical protein
MMSGVDWWMAASEDRECNNERQLCFECTRCLDPTMMTPATLPTVCSASPCRPESRAVSILSIYF